MKVFISADLEGVTGVTAWDETTPLHSDYARAAEQMTSEVAAACEAAIKAGATEIYIKDGHDNARNIDIAKLPEGVRLIRGWMNSPESMMGGIDGSFDAAIYIGYHSEAGSCGSPLSHTSEYPLISWVKINGESASEFTMNAYMAAYYQVPSIFLSGDKSICKSAEALVRDITAVSVKEGVSNATINITYEEACERIKDGVFHALMKLKNNKNFCSIDLPSGFELEIRFSRHQDANRAAYYPGTIRKDAHTVCYHSDNYMNIAIAYMFMAI